MMVVVAYDVSTETPEGRRRLRNVAKICMKYGQRVQNSVFECSVSPSDYLILKHDLAKIMDESQDSLRRSILRRLNIGEGSDIYRSMA